MVAGLGMADACRCVMRTFGLSGILFGFIVTFCVFLATCSSENPCVAAGGQCVTGGTMCKRDGPQDCETGVTPGGFYCCFEIEEPTFDASIDAPSETSDAPDAADVIADITTDADAAPFCSTPIAPGILPATLNDVPFDKWCAADPGRISESQCGAIVTINVGVGVDCHEQYFFDAVSKKLVAVAQGCNVELGTCVAGNSDFIPPGNCQVGAATRAINECAEGGLTTMAPDGAAAPCTSDSQCPMGYRCGYFTNNGCAGTAQCFYGDFDNNPTCTHQTRCACDGTTTEGCVGPWGGFTLKPVPTTNPGPCTD
jgi:hypothetical protein